MSARAEARGRIHILDVRAEREFASGHAPGAVNIPVFYIALRLSHVPGSINEELFLYCERGPRAYVAAAALRNRGYTRIVYMAGHFAGWRSAELRVEH